MSQQTLMHRLTLSLLGTAQVVLNQNPIAHFRSAKVQGLLAYLAINAEKVHARESLMALLWPDDSQETARLNLRQALYRLRQVLGDAKKGADPPFLLIDRQAVQFNLASDYLLDVAAFRTHVAAGQLEEAAALYQGELLVGFSCDSSTFDEWLLLTRQELHQQITQILLALTQNAAEQGNYPQVHQYARRLLALEPWHEEAHQQIMLALASSGEYSQALAHYESCRTILWEELGVEPSAETEAVVAKIQDDRTNGSGMASWQASQMNGAVMAPPIPSRQQPPLSITLSLPEPASKPRYDWGEIPHPDLFYGRTHELEQLEAWLHSCRLITVLGMGGQGKTTLAATLIHGLTQQEGIEESGVFDVIIWRSLLNAPALDTILNRWLSFLSEQRLIDLPESLDERLMLLLEQLRQQRCLLVLDNVESILQPGSEEASAGRYRPGYDAYAQLFQRIGESQHQSVLLLTSREKPLEVARLERRSPYTRTLQLEGLDGQAGQNLLQTLGISEQYDTTEPLLNRYSGNPLALMLIAEVIQDFFDGDVETFLQSESLIFEDVRYVLEQQFMRLSSLEQEVLIWLAIEREPLSIDALRQNLMDAGPKRALLEAVRSLQRRSLLEKITPEPEKPQDQIPATPQTALFALQNVITEYITDYIIEQACREIETADLRLLHSHALLKANAKEYVRESQARLILTPIAERLNGQSGHSVERHILCDLLTQLRSMPPNSPSYAAGNLLNLLILMEANLNGADFSDLAVRQAYLQGVYLPEINFTGANLAQSVFTDAFSAVLSVAFCPDGELLAAGTENREIRIWHVADGRPCAQIDAQTSIVNQVAFHPSGSVLAGAGEDGSIHLWQITDKAAGRTRQLHCLQGHEGAVKSIAFHPDGRILASAGADQRVRLWNVVNGTPHGEPLIGHTDWVMSLAFSPDGKTLASASDDCSIRLWDWADGQTRQVLQGHTEWVLGVAISPDGQFLASASRDTTVCLWNLATGQRLHTLEGHRDWVAAVAFSPNGRILATSGKGGPVRLWETASGKPLQLLQKHDIWVRALAFHPHIVGGQQLLASGSVDQTICLWSTPNGHLLQTYQGYRNWFRSIVFAPSGRELASASVDQNVRILDVASGQTRHMLQGHTIGVTSVAYTPDGRLVASGGADRTVRLWSTETGQLHHELHGHAGVIFTVAFCPAGRTVASASDDGTLRLWDVQSGRQRHILRGHAQRVNAVTFSTLPLHFRPCLASAESSMPASQPSDDPVHIVASASDDQTIRLWNMYTGEQVMLLQGHTDWVRTLAFQPPPSGNLDSDSQILASASTDRTIRLWDLATQETNRLLRGHDGEVTCLSFSPDGTLLASAGADQTIRLWDPDSGEIRHILQGHTNIIWSLAFAPNGKILVSSSADETYRYWDVSTGECLQIAYPPGPYANMNITDAVGLTLTQRNALKTLGAIENSMS